jgi:hypothetical protein
MKFKINLLQFSKNYHIKINLLIYIDHLYKKRLFQETLFILFKNNLYKKFIKCKVIL